MSIHPQPAEPVTSNIIAFTVGKNATTNDVHQLCTNVINRAHDVTDGIVAFLRESGMVARATSFGGQWFILVGPTDEQFTHPDPKRADPTTAVNIVIIARTVDHPHVVYALDNFFINWRAVPNLFAARTARVGTAWLLQVVRQQ